MDAGHLSELLPSIYSQFTKQWTSLGVENICLDVM